MPRWTVLCCLVAALWVAELGDARRSDTATTTHTVVIDGVLFTPAALTVTVGAAASFRYPRSRAVLR